MTADHFAAAEPSPSIAATIDAIRVQFGFVPDGVARLATAPEVLRALLQSFAAFERTSLPPLARETVIMTVAHRNGCELCLALHTAKLTQHSADPTLIAALRDGSPLPESSLEGIRQFTLRVMETTGAVGIAALEAFFAAGYTREQALEVIQGIGTYTFSTFANRMIGARIDPAFAMFAAEDALRS